MGPIIHTFLIDGSKGEVFSYGANGPSRPWGTPWLAFCDTLRMLIVLLAASNFISFLLVLLRSVRARKNFRFSVADQRRFPTEEELRQDRRLRILEWQWVALVMAVTGMCWYVTETEVANVGDYVGGGGRLWFALVGMASLFVWLRIRGMREIRDTVETWP